jgi:hypothetical protein
MDEIAISPNASDMKFKLFRLPLKNIAAPANTNFHE